MHIAGEIAGYPAPVSQYLPLEGLHKLSSSVNRAERLEQVYEASIEALLSSVGADRASILLYDRGQVMRFVASQGISEEYRLAVEGHSPWTPETVDAEPILVDDVELAPDLKDYLPTFLREGIRAIGFIPLMYRTKLLGKFMVYFDRPHVFTADERMLAQTIANHVAFAIEQKRTESNLRLYRKVFEHSPTAIGIIDLAGQYLEQNASHQELIGYSSDELVSKTPAIHLGQDGFDEIVSALQASDAFEKEMVSTTKDGRKLDIDLTAFTVREEDGTPLCFVGIKHDITARKDAERRILHLNADLEKRVEQRTAALQQAKDEMEGFCYSVSHDLRAPLRGMNSAASILLQDHQDSLNDDGKDLLTRLVANSNRMARLIDDLLQYSRLSRKEPSRVLVDLSSLAQRVVDELKSRNPDWRKTTFRIGNAPPVEVDPKLFELVMVNLLENAAKFSGFREDACVEFAYESLGGKGAFYVRDNGAGFDPQYAGKLFLPFERLHLESEFPGTGIGLANTKRIIERHGGTIWGEGEPGKGATFYFTIGCGPASRSSSE